jgi:CheY-like chemotaxis protein
MLRSIIINNESMDPASRHPLVFIVDDDRDTREMYQVVLESVGYRVVAAPHVNGVGGLLRDETPNVVLTDWMLPDGDGLAVCDLLRGRAATRHVPVLSISGLAFDGEQAAVARQRGVVTMLEKPVDPDAILESVRQAVMLETKRRVRRGAERTRRYAHRLQCRLRNLGGDRERVRGEAEALLARVSARSDHPLTLMLADDSAHYVAVGGDSQDLTGYQPHELEDLTVWDLTPPPAALDAQGLWRQFITAGLQEGRYTLRRRDGAAVVTDYCAIANIAPGLHVSALAQAMEMPGSFA